MGPFDLVSILNYKLIDSLNALLYNFFIIMDTVQPFDSVRFEGIGL